MFFRTWLEEKCSSRLDRDYDFFFSAFISGSTEIMSRIPRNKIFYSLSGCGMPFIAFLLPPS